MGGQHCTQCHAALPLAEPGTVVTCSFCGMQNRIAIPTHYMPPAPPPPPPPAWQPPLPPQKTPLLGLWIGGAIILLAIVGTVATRLAGPNTAEEHASPTNVGHSARPPVPQAHDPADLAALPSETGTTTSASTAPAGSVQGTLDVKAEPPAPTGITKDGIGGMPVGAWAAMDMNGMPGSVESFDPMKAYPWLLALAQAWKPDARIDRYWLRGLRPDGTLDATAGGNADITFVSPQAVEAAKAANLAGAEPDPTEIRFELDEGELQGYLSTHMRQPPPAAARLPEPTDVVPRCSMQTVLGLMRLHGVPARPTYELNMSWNGGYGGSWWWSYSGPVPDDVPYSPSVEPVECSVVGGKAPAAVGANGRLKPDVSIFQKLARCSCRMDVDLDRAGEESITLAVQLLPAALPGAEGTSPGAVRLAYAFHGGGDVFLPPVSAQSSPPAFANAGALGLGLACVNGVVLVSAQSAVSAWSWSERRLLWTTTLPGPVASPEPTDGSFVVDCSKLEIADDALTVPFAGGGSARLLLSDGSLAPDPG
ncbi:MAG: hypothetical protein HY907_15900 [Deltaproteobacteria bacterium]|nr:hypothetical protein [Deltaproteobacteria bacterium]